MPRGPEEGGLRALMESYLAGREAGPSAQATPLDLSGPHRLAWLVWRRSGGLEGSLDRWPEARRRLAAEIQHWVDQELPEAGAPSLLDRKTRAFKRLLDESQASGDTDPALLACLADLKTRWAREAESSQAQHREHLEMALARDRAHFADRIRVLKEREEKIRDWFGQSPGLWDLEEGEWNQLDWSGLEAAEALLHRFPPLRRLAETLGRGFRAEVPEHLSPATALERRQVKHILALGREGIEGLSLSRDLEILALHEFAWLSSPSTADYFLARWAMGNLDAWDYRTQKIVAHPDSKLRVAATPPPDPQERGPLIICLDTSGSMAGKPEAVAKALVLALSRWAPGQQRRVLLLAFSTDLRVFALEDPERQLAEYCRFLGGGFHGGTDLRPALTRARESIQREGWKDADVVVVSDFQVPKLMIKKAHEFEPLRRDRGTRVLGVSVSSRDVKDELQVFDRLWQIMLDRGGDPVAVKEH